MKISIENMVFFVTGSVGVFLVVFLVISREIRKVIVLLSFFLVVSVGVLFLKNNYKTSNVFSGPTEDENLVSEANRIENIYLELEEILYEKRLEQLEHAYMMGPTNEDEHKKMLLKTLPTIDSLRYVYKDSLFNVYIKQDLPKAKKDSLMILINIWYRKQIENMENQHGK